jgi:hypothetical protein
MDKKRTVWYELDGFSKGQKGHECRRVCQAAETKLWIKWILIVLKSWKVYHLILQGVKANGGWEVYQLCTA